jgi:cell division protein FtsZ
MSIDQIHRLLDDGTKMCFVTAGMGGGTGTGAAPVIAGEAKSMGILTIGIVTIPFYFEKRKKIIKALQGVEELRKNVDALLIINNERISDIYSDSEVTVKEAFKRADQILCDATKSISELITVEGDINLDFKDVETTLRGGGGAIMAIGRGEGEHRVEKAVIDALDSPLLYGSEIDSATRILFNIYTSQEHSLRVREMNDIDNFMDALNPNIDVIWGVSDDDSLGEAAKVTILATGVEDKFAPKFSLKDNDDYIENLIKQLYKPYKKSNFIQNEEDKEENTHNENKTIEIENPPLDGIEVTVTTSASTVTEEQPTSNPTYDQAPHRRPSFVERAKSILNKLSELTEEPE